MTNQGNGAPLLYGVHLSGIAKEQVKGLFQEELEKGTGQRFINVLRTIVEHLRNRPHQFGEYLYRLPALRLLVYHGAIAPLLVDYGVHEEQPIVFIRGVRALPG